MTNWPGQFAQRQLSEFLGFKFRPPLPRPVTGQVSSPLGLPRSSQGWMSIDVARRARRTAPGVSLLLGLLLVFV